MITNKVFSCPECKRKYATRSEVIKCLNGHEEMENKNKQKEIELQRDIDALNRDYQSLVKKVDVFNEKHPDYNVHAILRIGDNSENDFFANLFETILRENSVVGARTSSVKKPAEQSWANLRDGLHDNQFGKGVNRTSCSGPMPKTDIADFIDRYFRW